MRDDLTYRGPFCDFHSWLGRKIGCEKRENVYVCCLLDKTVMDYIKNNPQKNFYINVNSYNLQGYAQDSKLKSGGVTHLFLENLKELQGKNNCFLVNPSNFTDDMPRKLAKLVTAVDKKRPLPKVLNETIDTKFGLKKLKKQAKVAQISDEEYEQLKEFIEEREAEARNTDIPIVTRVNNWRQRIKANNTFQKICNHKKTDKRDREKILSSVTAGPKLSNDFIGLVWCAQNMTSPAYEVAKFKPYQEGNDLTYKGGSIDPLYIQQTINTEIPEMNFSECWIDMEADDGLTIACLDRFNRTHCVVHVQLSASNKKIERIPTENDVKKLAGDNFDFKFFTVHYDQTMKSNILKKMENDKQNLERENIELHRKENEIDQQIPDNENTESVKELQKELEELKYKIEGNKQERIGLMVDEPLIEGGALPNWRKVEEFLKELDIVLDDATEVGDDLSDNATLTTNPLKLGF